MQDKHREHHGQDVVEEEAPSSSSSSSMMRVTSLSSPVPMAIKIKDLGAADDGDFFLGAVGVGVGVLADELSGLADDLVPQVHRTGAARRDMQEEGK